MQNGRRAGYKSGFFISLIGASCNVLAIIVLLILNATLFKINYGFVYEYNKSNIVLTISVILLIINVLKVVFYFIFRDRAFAVSFVCLYALSLAFAGYLACVLYDMIFSDIVLLVYFFIMLVTPFIEGAGLIAVVNSFKYQDDTSLINSAITKFSDTDIQNKAERKPAGEETSEGEKEEK